MIISHPYRNQVKCRPRLYFCSSLYPSDPGTDAAIALELIHISSVYDMLSMVAAMGREASMAGEAKPVYWWVTSATA